MATSKIETVLNAAPPTSRETTRRVSVVGAGFGGLAAGYELSRAGYTVDVFEARNRIGGRVHSVDRFAPDRVVEYGAELIGENHLLWMRYAKRFGIELETLDDDEEPTELIMNDLRIAGSEARKLEAEVQVCRDLMAFDALTAEIETPWMTPNAERWDNLSLQERIDQFEITDQAKQAVYLEFLLDMACAPEKMSYLALMCIIKAHGEKRYWTDTETYRAKQGSQILASYLAQGVSGNIYLDCPVEKIEQREDRCSITLRDGRSMDYNDVVLATPPSVWNRIAFTPSLPVGFQPQMGSVTKFLAVVKDSFWKPDGQTDLLTDTRLGITWEGAKSKNNSDKLLVAFAGGTIADSLHQALIGSQEQLICDAFEQAIPGFANNHLKSEFIDWIGDEWSKGGYSFPLPGQFLAQSRIISEGLGSLHFAGEHASFGFSGFMEGGLHSGVLVANRIMQRDGVKVSVS